MSATMRRCRSNVISPIIFRIKWQTGFLFSSDFFFCREGTCPPVLPVPRIRLLHHLHHHHHHHHHASSLSPAPSSNEDRIGYTTQIVYATHTGVRLELNGRSRAERFGENSSMANFVAREILFLWKTNSPQLRLSYKTRVTSVPHKRRIHTVRTSPSQNFKSSNPSEKIEECKN